MLYAGARPARVRRLVNLEGFGMAATHPEQAPARAARWMDEIKALHRGDKNLRTYAELADVAQRLMRTNPRLSQSKADWLATHWASQARLPDGRTAWAILGHPAHRIVNAYLYRVEEAVAAYRQISAPVLAVEAVDGIAQTWKKRNIPDDFLSRLQAVPQLRHVKIEAAGHMLHHDQPEQIAALIEEFAPPDRH